MGIFFTYAIVLATVIPVLIPVKEPGPLTTIISLISFKFVSSFIQGKSSEPLAFYIIFFLNILPFLNKITTISYI